MRDDDTFTIEDLFCLMRRHGLAHGPFWNIDVSLWLALEGMVQDLNELAGPRAEELRASLIAAEAAE